MNLKPAPRKIDLAPLRDNISVLEERLARLKRDQADLQEGPDQDEIRLLEATVQSAREGLQTEPSATWPKPKPALTGWNWLAWRPSLKADAWTWIRRRSNWPNWKKAPTKSYWTVSIPQLTRRVRRWIPPGHSETTWLPDPMK